MSGQYQSPGSHFALLSSLGRGRGNIFYVFCNLDKLFVGIHDKQNDNEEGTDKNFFIQSFFYEQKKQKEGHLPELEIQLL